MFNLSYRTFLSREWPKYFPLNCLSSSILCWSNCQCMLFNIQRIFPLYIVQNITWTFLEHAVYNTYIITNSGTRNISYQLFIKFAKKTPKFSILFFLFFRFSEQTIASSNGVDVPNEMHIFMLKMHIELPNSDQSFSFLH